MTKRITFISLLAASALTGVKTHGAEARPFGHGGGFHGGGFHGGFAHHGGFGGRGFRGGYGGYRGYGYRGNGGAAVAAGILGLVGGLAAGAALADAPAYGYGYAPAYGYAPCRTVRDVVFDAWGRPHRQVYTVCD